MLLFLGGGGTTDPAMARAFVAAARERPIVVLALTREEPLVSGPKSVDLMRESGARNVTLFHATSPTEGDRQLLAAKVRAGAAIWVPGGDQRLLPARLGREWWAREIRPYITVYGGTSAGAMLASDPMIAGPGDSPDTVEIVPGLGLTRWVVDTHYRERNRAKRLADGVRRTGRPGLGISEKAWVVLEGSRLREVHGAVDRVR